MTCGILLPWPQPWKHQILTSRPPGNSLKFAIFFSILSFSVCIYFDISYSPWWASQVTLVVKNLPANAGDIRDVGSIPGWGRSPGGGHSNHSSTHAWRIPWTEESGGLWSIGSQRVGHDWATKHSTVRVQSADWYILRSQQISKKIIPSFTDETLKASETWSRFLGGWQSWTSIQIFWCHVWSHPMVTWKSKIRKRRDFLVVWWLRCCTSNAGGMSLIPGQGTKSPHIAQCGKNIYRGKRKKEKWKIWCLSERIHLQYRRRGLIPGLGISPREGNGYPF